MSDHPDPPAAEGATEHVNAESTLLPAGAEDAASVVVAFTGGQQRERERAVEIIELCKAAGRPLLAAELVRSGTTIEQVRRHLLDLIAQAAAPPIVPINIMGEASKPSSHVEAFAARGMRAR